MSSVFLELPFSIPEPRVGVLAPRVDRLSESSWVLYQRGWVTGADRLRDVLVERVAWKAGRRQMYDREVDVPRLLGGAPDPAVPEIDAMRSSLQRCLGVELDRTLLAHYRSGQDSVAWHGDRIGMHRPWSVVAVVSLGGPRRFLVRPAGGGRSIRYDLGSGDVIVMAGRMQEEFDHCVPKQAFARSRVALMFRHSQPMPASHRPGL